MEYLETQSLAGESFACHIWMNATMHHIPVQEYWEMTYQEERVEGVVSPINICSVASLFSFLPSSPEWSSLFQGQEL